LAGLSKGVGFVRFDLRHEAERSIKQLNGLIPDGSGEPITVKFANSPSSSRHAGSTSAVNNNHFPLSSASMAAYLSPTRRLMGSLHHPANRFRYVYTPAHRTSPIYLPSAAAHVRKPTADWKISKLSK